MGNVIFFCGWWVRRTAGVRSSENFACYCSANGGGVGLEPRKNHENRGKFSVWEWTTLLFCIAHSHDQLKVDSGWGGNFISIFLFCLFLPWGKRMDGTKSL